MLVRAVTSLTSLIQPDPFRSRREQRPVTLADLSAACAWTELVQECDLPADANPLVLAGLRYSRVFPEMFLKRVGDSVIVLTLAEAADAVAVAAREHAEH